MKNTISLSSKFKLPDGNLKTCLKAVSLLKTNRTRPEVRPKTEDRRLKTKHPRSIIIFVLAAVFVFSPTVFLAAKDNAISVEGIVYEDKNPSQSFVIIDGEFHQQGKSYHAYEVTEIRKDRVVLKSANGTLSEHRISGNPSAKHNAPPPQKLAAKKQLSATKDNEPPSGWDKIAKMFGIEKGFNPLQLLSFAKDTAVINDMRKLYSQVNNYLSESGGKMGSMDEMIKHGSVDPAFKQNKNDYTYRAEDTEKGVQVYADPLNGKAKHFMIDAWGNLRVEEDHPATAQSPLFQVPSLAGSAATESAAK